mgnify:FL=1
MRLAGRVETATWADARFQALTREAQLVYLYILSGPNSHGSGLFYCPPGYVAEDLNMAPATISDALAAIAAARLIARDGKWVFVPGIYTAPANANVGKSYLRHWSNAPDGACKQAAAKAFHETTDFPARDLVMQSRLKAYADGHIRASQTVSEPVTEPIPKPAPDLFFDANLTRSQSGGGEGKGEGEGEGIIPPQPPQGGVSEAVAERAGEPDLTPPPCLRRPPQPAPDDPDWAAFVAAYPWRAGDSRERAREAWGWALEQGHEPADIIAGARAYAEAQAKPGAVVTKNAKRWLSGLCWQAVPGDGAPAPARKADWGNVPPSALDKLDRQDRAMIEAGMVRASWADGVLYVATGTKFLASRLNGDWGEHIAQRLGVASIKAQHVKPEGAPA